MLHHDQSFTEIEPAPTRLFETVSSPVFADKVCSVAGLGLMLIYLA